MIGGDATFPDHVINTYDYFPDRLYFGCGGQGNPLLVRLSFFCGGLDFPLVFSRLATVWRPQGRRQERKRRPWCVRGPSGQLLLQGLTTFESRPSIKVEG